MARIALKLCIYKVPAYNPQRNVYKMWNSPYELQSLRYKIIPLANYLFSSGYLSITQLRIFLFEKNDEKSVMKN